MTGPRLSGPRREDHPCRWLYLLPMAAPHLHVAAIAVHTIPLVSGVFPGQPPGCLFPTGALFMIGIDACQAAEHLQELAAELRQRRFSVQIQNTAGRTATL